MLHRVILIQRLCLCILATALLAGCGSPGVPVPPSLELAKPVSDLHAARKGDQVFLAWTIPTRTTDGHNIRHSGATQICRSIGTAMQTCGTPVAEVGFQKSTNEAGKQIATYTDQLSPNLEFESPTSYFSYAVTVLNSYGRSAGLSNQVQVSAAPTLPAPSDFQAELTADGVRLNWKPISTPSIPGVRFAVRIYRHETVSNTDSIAGEVPVTADATMTFLDRNFGWEKTYDYRVCVVTFAGHENTPPAQVEGDDTPPITVVAHDVFPPARPSGLQAVFSGPGQKPFIDLVWTPNTESDLAGYNVYRHEQGNPVKLNSDLVKAPAFRDDGVLPGHTYSYSISAVDLRGNESPQSEEAS